MYVLVVIDARFFHFADDSLLHFSVLLAVPLLTAVVH